MFWATSEFKVTETSPEFTAALRAWRDHIEDAHKDVKEVRCYRYNGGTHYVWQEGFEDFIAYQRLMEQEDDVCATVMGAVFKHVVPGSRSGRIWSDGL